MLCTHKQAIPFVMCLPGSFIRNPDESKNAYELHGDAANLLI